MQLVLPPPVLVITLSLPDPRLSPNAKRGGSRQGRQGVVKAYRRQACAKWKAAKNLLDTLDQATGLAVFYRQKGGKLVRDEDNAAAMLKSVWDGAKDAGVIVSDSRKHFRALSPVLAIDAQRPRLEVAIFEGLVEYVGPGAPENWRT